MDTKPKRHRKVDDDAKIARALDEVLDACNDCATAWMMYSTGEDIEDTTFGNLERFTQRYDELKKSIASVNAGRALRSES